jgi:MBOAT, membrane-bound O-acyltransferase family
MQDAHQIHSEFSRKWNKPVHAFLLRHVYASTIASYDISRTTAMFLTFLLSAAAHELVMVIVTGKLRYVVIPSHYGTTQLTGHVWKHVPLSNASECNIYGVLGAFVDVSCSSHNCLSSRSADCPSSDAISFWGTWYSGSAFTPDSHCCVLRMSLTKSAYGPLGECM